MNCWHCGTELIWGGDHDFDEDSEGLYDVVTNLSCPNCGAYVEVYRPNLDHPDHKVESKLEIPSPTPDASWLDEVKTQDGE